MAVWLLAYQVADLCLGKPPLRSLYASATVADALAALKSSEENFVSLWSCDHKRALGDCKCTGKVCMVDIICFLSRDENLASPGLAFQSPVSVLLPKNKGRVRHVDPSSSLLEAINLILEDAQNLVVPIKSSSKRKLPTKSSKAAPTSHNGQEFCWLTQEDIIRFLLSSIGLFSPISTLSIAALGVVSSTFHAVECDAPASSAIGAISRAISDQTSVAVVDDGGTFIGEISPFTLACCDETVVAAVVTLSAGELMAYIDWGGPPDEIVKIVEQKLRDKNLEGIMEALMIDQCNSNSGELVPLSRSGWSSGGHSGRIGRRAEVMVCHPGSSLVAVMIQAIAHRVNCVWVIDDDGSVAGIVTFANMLKVFGENLEAMV